MSHDRVFGIFSLLTMWGRLASADADLSVTNTSATGGVKPPGNVAYVVVVNNSGPDPAGGVLVTDATPDGLTFVSNSGDCATAFPCVLGTLASGQTRTITATFSVPASYNGPNPILNTAIATTSTTDNAPANNSATAATAVTRVAGYHTLPPCRVADTRGSAGVPIGGPALAAGAARAFPVRRLCGLPDNAIAVSFNVTVTAPTGAGDLRIFPGGGAVQASAINYTPGQTRANNGIVPVGADGSVAVQCDQASGSVHFILDVNGYFAATDAVATPAGQNVRIRPAPEVEITFDNVTQAGVTSAAVIEFGDNRPGSMDQHLRDFFPPGSPLQTLLPDVIVPSFIVPLGKGGATGPPTFVLSLIDTTAKFARTAEFHGFEDFRLGWDPPCVVAADHTQEPRTFYAREAAKGEPALVEETAFGGPVLVDISSGCGSNKGSGWNFSLYLTAKDTRTPRDLAQYMMLRIQDALSALGAFITNATVASNLLAEVQGAFATLDTAPADALGHMVAFIGIVDSNPTAFDNTARNVSGELVGRALSARYMLGKLAPVPTGTITEFPIPTAAASPRGIAAGPDGNLWFTEFNKNQIGRITPTGSIVEFVVPTTNSHPVDIVAGPDGNLWFTEFSSNKIGRLTPAGVITEFTVPTAGGGPVGIAAGPDGNVWFTEQSPAGNRIGRITSAGVITEFPIPTVNSQPSGIVTGPDGNLWFAENSGDSIGRITPSGSITEFPVPTGGCVLDQIAVGPDGNLWFTYYQCPTIGRITPGGVITEFPVGTTSTYGVAAGPDGNLWFTKGPNKIARITAAGSIVEFTIPGASSFPEGIVLGPDGNMWFTEFSNKIGRIVP